MEIMRSVTRSAGLVVVVPCSRGSRPRALGCRALRALLTRPLKLGESTISLTSHGQAAYFTTKLLPYGP